jgi:Glycosyl transferase family 2
LNEEVNLPLALASLQRLDAEIFVVDSGSTDATRAIARAAGCQVVEHPFENYALQRNWAFDQLPIGAPWTLCLDADERLTPELVEEIEQTLSRQDTPYDGYMLRKRTIFMGRWLRHGGQYPAYHLRLFRSGRGRCEARLYDQHFVVDGRVGRLSNDYIDVITSDLATFIARHNRWAELEAAEILARRTGAVRSGPAVAPLLIGTAIEAATVPAHARLSAIPAVPAPVPILVLWLRAAPRLPRRHRGPHLSHPAAFLVPLPDRRQDLGAPARPIANLEARPPRASPVGVNDPERQRRPGPSSAVAAQSTGRASRIATVGQPPG